MGVTKSQTLFAQLCAARNVPCQRIPEGIAKTPDYRIDLLGQDVIVEVKQLDPNDSDRARWESVLRHEPQSMWGSPADRIQGALRDAYPQIKAYAEHPCMVVLYNNCPIGNDIDDFTVSRAMFGKFAALIGTDGDGVVQEYARKFRGDRFATKDQSRALSAVAVLDDRHTKHTTLTVYHNPYGTMPINRIALARLATEQFFRDAPHESNWVSVESNRHT